MDMCVMRMFVTTVRPVRLALLVREDSHGHSQDRHWRGQCAKWLP